MRLLTHDYLAIDWSPQMVETCRRLYPGLDVREGDARDLSGLHRRNFKLVLFSYNGIDAIDHKGRLRVYDTARRVLRSDGIFAYSTLLKGGYSYVYGLRPWWPRPGPPTLRQVARGMFNVPRHLPQIPRRWASWWMGRKSMEDHGDWALSPQAGLDFRLLHFTTVDAERSVLAEHGFAVSEMFGDRGEAITGETTRCRWFFVVARSTPIAATE